MQLHAFLIYMGWSCQASAILSTYLLLLLLLLLLILPLELQRLR